LIKRDSTPTIEAVVLWIIALFHGWLHNAQPITNGVVTPQAIMIMPMVIANEMPSTSAMDVPTAVIA
jgi:hypothetical protein